MVTTFFYSSYWVLHSVGSTILKIVYQSLYDSRFNNYFGNICVLLPEKSNTPGNLKFSYTLNGWLQNFIYGYVVLIDIYGKNWNIECVFTWPSQI